MLGSEGTSTGVRRVAWRVTVVHLAQLLQPFVSSSLCALLMC